jgi:WD40 repeat protein
MTNILASGGDDLTIRIWDVDLDEVMIRDGRSGDGMISKVKELSPTTTLLGHRANVRALCWNSEHKSLLLSGSWDSTIRVWDVLNAVCLQVVSSHVADVYSITSHVDRPFTFVSCSRDTTIRVWELGGLFIECIKTRAIWEASFESVIGSGRPSSSDATDESATTPTKCPVAWLSGRKSLARNIQLSKMKTDDPTSALTKAHKYQILFNFFAGSTGANEVWEVALFILNKMERSERKR